MSDPAITPLVLERLPNWAERYNEYVLAAHEGTKYESLAFGWDSTDPSQVNCLTWSMGAVEALTGVNPYNVLGIDLAYSNMFEAIKAIQDRGFTSMEGLLTAVFPVIRPVMVQAGDLVLVPRVDAPDELGPWDLGIGVADPPYFWSVGERGLDRGSTSRAVKAFKVG